MNNRFFETAFTPSVKAEQEKHGSRVAYARLDGTFGGPVASNAFTERETRFIAERDSFYIASVSETGWPYLQHRGGPSGFVKVLGDGAMAWADFRGNRQYVSIGNVATNDRVALFFMDYPDRRRLKVLGHMRVFEPGELPELEISSMLGDYSAKVEHFVRVEVEAFDWNCPQHITPRFTLAEVEAAAAPLHARIAELERQLAAQTG